MKTRWTWFLVAVLLIFIGLYFGIKFGTAHGVIKINPETGTDNLSQQCEDKDFVLILGEFFICN